MTKEDFLNEMTWFLEFYDKTLSDRQSYVWYEVFKDFDKADFSHCLKIHIKYDEQPFFPALGKIFSLIKPRKIQ